MKIFKKKSELKKEISKDKDVCFVPTMGGFHLGHISLIKKSKRFKGKTLVSIFVNPRQFNEKRDFFKYPRNLKKDLTILNNLKVDYVYLPTSKDIFNFRTTNKIYLNKFSKTLCGKTRKKHFKGVLDVVNRFLEIIRPKNIFLGNKDFQQLILIKKHIKKRNIKTKVIACTTVREKNGVACSTRNKRLTQNQFKIASNVYSYLKNKKKSPDIFKLNYKDSLFKLGVCKIDYLEILNLKTLKKPKKLKEKFNIFIAYYLGKIRLIDNI